jgi:LPXTG-motif cell wall-anchored protein
MSQYPTLRASARVAAALGVSACVLIGGAHGAAAADAFTISGDLSSTLYPGGSGSLNLHLTNPGDTELTVGEITVSVASVTTQPQRTCLVSDFVVDQLDAARQFTLPAHSTQSLTDLGVAAADLPRVTMTNTPVNQDGCKGSTANLAFHGMAAEVGGVSIPPATPTPTPNQTPKPAPKPDDGIVGGVHLPGTGGDESSFWVALGGLGLVVLGTGSVVVTRRAKGAQQ